MDQSKTTFDTGAKRVEAQPPYAQIPPCALRRLAMIFEEGEKVYGLDNWKQGLPWYSTYNHLMEHLQKYHEGDRSEDHLAKVMWGCVVQIYFNEKETEKSKQIPLTASGEIAPRYDTIAYRMAKDKLTGKEYNDLYMPSLEHPETNPTSDFHLSQQDNSSIQNTDPRDKPRDRSVPREQLAYNVTIAMDHLEYTQGVDNLHKAVDALIEYERARADRKKLMR